MSAQRLGPKGIRRTARKLGEPVLMAWAAGNHHTAFVTPDHRHGVLAKQGDPDVQWAAHDDRDQHYTSCFNGTLQFDTERAS